MSLPVSMNIEKLGFAPNTAGGIMDLNFITVEVTDTFDHIKRRVVGYEKRTGRIPTLLVVEKGHLVGELSYQAFLFQSQTHQPSLKKFLHPIATIHHSQGKEKILEIIRHHPHKRIAVLDNNENILGIIYSDDIIRLLQKESTAGLYDFAGVKEEEDVFDRVLLKVRHRYKWLILNLATACLAAWTVSQFEDILSQFVLLAAYMPIVAGMGGNAGTQTLAVMVRSLTLGEIELKNSVRALVNEVGAGLINGLISGGIMALIALLWNQSPLLGIVTGFAILVNLIVAGFFGALIPLIMKKLGKDPATSATIFITTATDVFGFLTFLGLATLVLS